MEVMVVGINRFFPLQLAPPTAALPIHAYRAGDGFSLCQGINRLLPQNSQEEISDFIFFHSSISSVALQFDGCKVGVSRVTLNLTLSSLIIKCPSRPLSGSLSFGLGHQEVCQRWYLLHMGQPPDEHIC